MIELSAATLLERAPLDLGVSAWHLIDQRRIDSFADATGDHQWIHVDPQRASAGPFGTTVAHGYLTLSLVPALLKDLLHVDGERLGVNYGIERLRFTAPVPAGSEIRLRARVEDGEARGDGFLLRLPIEVEISGGNKPAVVGELLYLSFPVEAPPDKTPVF